MTEKDETLSAEQLSELRFIQYVSILANAGMQQLGKIINPVSGKTDKNLEAANATIEVLAMLKEKTKGNLTSSEEQVISGALANLQLNYADEINRPKENERKT